MTDLDKLIGILKKSSNNEKRRNAVDMLLQMGSSNPAVLAHSTPALIGAMSDSDEGVVRRAAFALYKASVMNPDIVANYIPYLIKFMATISKRSNHSSYGAYSSIVNALGVIGEKYPDAVAQSIPYLSACINYPIYHPENPHSDLDKLYSSVVRTLGRIGRVRPKLVANSLPYIVRCLTDSFKYKSFMKEDPNDKTSLRWSAAFAIDTIGHSIPNLIVPQLVKLMTDSRKDIRDFGYYELKRLSEEPQNVIPSLVHTMGDQKPSMREEATKFMVELGLKFPKVTVSALVTCFQSKNEHVRQNAALALGEIGKSKPNFVSIAIKPLLQRLSDENKEVRQQAIDALYKISEKNISMVVPGIKDLVDALKDSYHHVRWRAVIIIGMVGEKNQLLVKDAIPILAHMFNDPQDHVRWRAEEALKRIGVSKSDYLLAEKAITTVKTLISEGQSRKADMTETMELLQEAYSAMDQMDYKAVQRIGEEAKLAATRAMESPEYSATASPSPSAENEERKPHAHPAVEDRKRTQVYSAPSAPQPDKQHTKSDGEKIFCPYCGAENYSNFNFCIKCRKPLPKIDESDPSIVATGNDDMETKLNIYRDAMEEALRDGNIGHDEYAMLKRLRETLGISMAEHERIEKEIISGNKE